MDKDDNIMNCPITKNYDGTTKDCEHNCAWYDQYSHGCIIHPLVKALRSIDNNIHEIKCRTPI